MQNRDEQILILKLSGEIGAYCVKGNAKPIDVILALLTTAVSLRVTESDTAARLRAIADSIEGAA